MSYRSFSMIYQLPPVDMLNPAADAAGRTSVYFSLMNAVKAFIVVTVNQGNAATVALTPLQATTVGGAGGKVLSGNVPIALVDASAVSSLYAVQAPAANFTTDANLANKKVVFEILPEGCMDMANGFSCIAIETGASNAANITHAELFILGSYEGANIPDPLLGPPA